MEEPLAVTQVQKLPLSNTIGADNFSEKLADNFSEYGLTWFKSVMCPSHFCQVRVTNLSS